MPTLDELVSKVMQMAENSQKARGIDNFGSLGYKGNIDREYQAGRSDALDKSLLDNKKLRVTERAQDIESQKANAALANATAVNAAKNATTLDAARIRAGLEGGDGTGRRGRGKDALELASMAATEAVKANPGLSGKPGSGANYATEFKKAHAAITAAQGGGSDALTFDKDENPVAVTNVPVAPTAETLSGQKALSEDRLKQYGAAKGYTYQGLQPGIQNNQIAKFVDANGVARFANTGAVSNALQGVPAPAASATATKSFSAPDSTKFGGTPSSATSPSTGPARMPGDWAGGIVRLLERHPGESASPLSPSFGTLYDNMGPETSMMAPEDAPVPIAPIVPERTDHLTAQGLANRPARFGGPGYLTTLTEGKSGPDTPRGFLDWAISDRKRRAAVGKDPFFGIGRRLNSPSKSTNPLFPSYGQ